MAEIFNFYVQDNRTIQFPKNNLLEPIMQEDYKVATWRFRIPKTLNGIDMSRWAWWFVYVNARGQEFSELLTLVDDIDEPDSFCTADYSIDYGISYHPGNFQFSLEAINADSGGEILNEWHTKTYAHKVDKTLQGNREQWSETESDIISALIVEVQNKVAQLVGGATPEPVSLIADMTDTKKVYLYVGSETGESTNYWYYYNGSAWVAGGLYASGITVDAVPTQGSNNAVRSGGVYEALQNIDARLNALGATWSNTAISLLEQIKSHVSFIDSEGSDLWDDLIVELDGAIPATYYAITWNGRNFSKSNNAISAREGKPYTCTVSPDSGYSISALSVIHNGNTVTPTDNGDGTYTISIANVGGVITASVTTALDSDVVDICLFAGQSNMDGRGTAEDATSVTTGLAYKWDNSNNRTVAFEAEGSLIPAYMQEYTSEEGVPLVEVKEAVGGTGIAQYVSDYLPLATNMLTRCKTYLEGQGKTVRRVFMLWCQGETDVDGDLSTGTQAYEGYFATLKSAVMQTGVNQIFIINIGQASNGTFDFAPIRTALQNACNGTDVIMVSDKFYNATKYMKDRWHYTQVIYNVVGKNSADNTIAFFNGQTPNVKRFDSSDIYGVPAEYGTLNDWTYEIVNEKVLLKAYNGVNADVRVYHQYMLDGYFYEARIARVPSSNANACFTGNTTIQSVTIDNGIRMMNPSGYTDADNQQDITNLFKGCTALQSVMLGTDFPDIVNISAAFRDATAFLTFNFAQKLHNLNNATYAFKGTALTSYGDVYATGNISNMFSDCLNLVSCGDLKGSYKQTNDMFSNCSNLETVGTIESTELTQIHRMFINCAKLTGTIRFEATGITACSNAFYGCDLSKITIECPANSTTYTTISTAYPTANIVTF